MSNNQQPNNPNLEPINSGTAYERSLDNILNSLSNFAPPQPNNPPAPQPAPQPTPEKSNEGDNS